MTYEEADDILKSRGIKKIGNNTWLVRCGDSIYSPIAIRLHATDVVVLHRSGNVGLDSGGYRTVTTRARMNQYAPGIRVVQRAFKWFVITEQGTREFEDGMVVDAVLTKVS
jgi:hypothetical protein